ncbi:MAG: hypothetical protein E6767_16165 [Dysgonomonas sp.]|nr:hypothetical protein [Dysgonomonas sp.]
MRLLILSACVLFASTLFAQNNTDSTTTIVQNSALLQDSIVFETTEATVQELEYYQGGPLSHLNVAVRLSTMGFGIEAATPLNSYLKLRAGINYMGYKSSDFDISLDDPSGMLEEAIGYVPDYNMKGELNFTNGHVLVDFHPVKKGIFHLTAGAYIGKNQLKAKGYLVDGDGNRATLIDPTEKWPNIDFDGHQLDINNGDLNATLQLGQVIKPYFGFGLGRAISKSRVSFKFEMGAIYQGKYTLKQNGKKVETISNAVENFEDIDKITNILKWWPMLNFQLTYRIF